MNYGYVLYIIPFVLAVVFQGLYFHTQYMTANIIIAAYASYKYFKKEGDLDKSPFFFALVAYVLMYFISISYAVNKQGAVQEAFRIAGYLPAYLIGIWSNGKEKEWIHKSIMLSGIMASAVGLAALSEILYLPGTLYGQRMQSTFHYANVTAVYLLIGLILSIRLLDGILKENIQWDYRVLLISLGIFTLTCGLILTYSHGVWIIFGFLSMFFIFSNRLLPNHQSLKRQYAFLLCISLITSAFLARVRGATFLAIFLVGAATSAASIYIPYLLEPVQPREQSSRFKPKKPLFTASIAVVLMALLIVFMWSKWGERIGIWIPTEWHARMAYYRGAVKLLMDYPLLGVGGRGWEVVGESYVGDYVKYVHNYFLQVLCDVGIVGLAFLFLFAAGVVHSFLKVKKADGYLFTVIAVIFLHSLIDVDMHFQLISMIFFLYCGMVSGKRSGCPGRHRMAMEESKFIG